MGHGDDKTNEQIAETARKPDPSMQLIDLARLLARQAAREHFAAQDAAKGTETEENDDDEDPA